MISSSRPSVQNARPWILWLCAAHRTSGLAAWIAEWIMNAAAFSSRHGPPSITWPSWLTRIRSLALIWPNDTPNGLTQNELGSTGSRRVMCPATPVQLSIKFPHCGGALGGERDEYPRRNRSSRRSGTQRPVGPLGTPFPHACPRRRAAWGSSS